MRFGVILAGGSGTRLWPWSRARLPKQLLPMAGGRTLLQMAFERLDGLVPAGHRCVCAGEAHREIITGSLGLEPEQYLGEPTGRDTLNALGLCAAVLGRRDPDAVLGVCTADHVIEPADRFRECFAMGFELAERHSDALVTFGITPTGPATGFGYLQLGEELGGGGRIVDRFREKPDLATAREFFGAGPERYLWNSGMFVWRAATLLDCLRRYEPATAEGLARIAAGWDTPDRAQVLAEVYPSLRKISVDFAVMEPASRDPAVRVLAVPMALKWLDVGSWSAFADFCPRDDHGNALAAARALLVDTSGTLVASNDPKHVIVTVGCEDLLIVHTPDATLVCRAGDAEAIKDVQKKVAQKFPDVI